MVTLLFDMNKDSFKPKIVSSEYPDLTLLIDTGADIPVWCLGVPAFKAQSERNDNKLTTILPITTKIVKGL